MHNPITKQNTDEPSIEEIKSIKGNEQLTDEEAELIRQDIIKLCDILAHSILFNK